MIKARLDTGAVRALLEGNPELQLELEQLVVRNITDDLLKVQIAERVDHYLNSIVVKSGSYYSPTYTLSAGYEKAVKAIVAEQATALAKESIKDKVQAAVTAQMNRLRLELQGEFKAMMREMLTTDMAKELMREKLLA